MTRAALAAAAAFALAGCPLVYGDDDDSSGGTAPQILSSFPGAQVQVLSPGDSIDFVARGEDPDSLELSWTFTRDDEFMASGQVDDGAFDVTWTFDYDGDLSGEQVEVRFSVSDGALATDRIWAVDVD